MSKAPKKAHALNGGGRSESMSPSRAEFDEILRLIDDARASVLTAVNTALIDLYWTLGEYISRRIDADGWGQGTVKDLADHIAKRRPNARGFSAQNLWRMRQFHDAYSSESKLSALLRELSWTHNLLIMGKCKRNEEREFYLRLAPRETWSKRELERQLAGTSFERLILPPANSSAPQKGLRAASGISMDAHPAGLLDFLADRSEAHLDGLPVFAND
jgi:predicted nuclease of restriction endonuclease-like (RecB) superfamily